MTVSIMYVLKVEWYGGGLRLSLGTRRVLELVLVLSFQLLSTNTLPRLCLCLSRQVSDLVLISPIPEDVFEEEMWRQYW